ncbi:polysaccharide biosynthesis/export family protein [Aliiruegeria lutimaris]|nr:polysaccharide biosynthesis/export family protein [Aliiruegeria lutimaris]
MRRSILITLLAGVAATLAGCGVIYNSPTVSQGIVNDAKVRVVPITAETTLAANRSPYQPDSLPAVFSQTAGGGSGLRGAGTLPDPAVDPETRPGSIETRIPADVPISPYRIGVGDVVVLATPTGGDSVAELSGLVAVQNQKQNYTVQDDGGISIPSVGRVRLAGLTLEEANENVFQALVDSSIDPSFSLEVAAFNSQRVSVGGAVRTPGVLPIGLQPLYLNEAISKAGGATSDDNEYVTVRIYRNGSLYQVPLAELYSQRKLQRIRLIDGDSVYVDLEYRLDNAQAYFQEQLTLNETRRSARQQAISELQTEISLRRAELDEARENFEDRVDFGAVDRDYVYLAGEVTKQARFPLPFEQRAVLADAIYAEGGIPTITGNVSEIYVLRGSQAAEEFGSITAWKLNAGNAASLLLATRFELRPNDVIFVAEQPVTQWNRVITQITPGVFNSTINALAR